MTGKHVCITVSASRASGGSGVQRLLLNHISTPNVTLASSVAASCAVPGVMAPAKLMIKDSRGKQVPFEVDGVEWIDGECFSFFCVSCTKFVLSQIAVFFNYFVNNLSQEVCRQTCPSRGYQHYSTLAILWWLRL